MKLTISKDYKNLKVGDVINVFDDYGKMLIKKGVAKTELEVVAEVAQTEVKEEKKEVEAKKATTKKAKKTK